MQGRPSRREASTALVVSSETMTSTVSDRPARHPTGSAGSTRGRILARSAPRRGRAPPSTAAPEAGAWGGGPRFAPSPWCWSRACRRQVALRYLIRGGANRHRLAAATSRAAS